MTSNGNHVRYVRVRTKPSPVCPIHGAPMIVRTVQHGFRRWYCPMTTCPEAVKEPASVALFEYVEVKGQSEK